MMPVSGCAYSATVVPGANTKSSAAPLTPVARKFWKSSVVSYVLPIRDSASVSAQ